MVIASVTLLPALLGAGRAPDQRVGAPRRSRGRAPAGGRGWERWVGHVSRHPGVYAVGVVGAAARRSPRRSLALRVGIPDDGALPASRTERRAYDLVAEGFGPGSNGPLVIAVDAGAATAAVVAPLARRRSRADPGIASVGRGARRPAPATSATISPSRRPARRTRRRTTRSERLRADVFPAVAGRQPGAGARRRADRQLGRRRRAGQRPAAGVHRRRARAVVPAADAGLPVGAGAAQGRRCSTC